MEWMSTSRDWRSDVAHAVGDGLKRRPQGDLFPRISTSPASMGTPKSRLANSSPPCRRRPAPPRRAGGVRDLAAHAAPRTEPRRFPSAPAGRRRRRPTMSDGFVRQFPDVLRFARPGRSRRRNTSSVVEMVLTHRGEHANQAQQVVRLLLGEGSCRLVELILIPAGPISTVFCSPRPNADDVVRGDIGVHLLSTSRARTSCPPCG